MKFFSYVVDRDFGFAPNPFHGICTLATCKPIVRKQAKIGDWVFGTGSKNLKNQNRLIYAMQVTDKITYNEYWTNSRYAKKKPLLNGSLVQMYGDNIYYNHNNTWSQANSHHSNEDGSINFDNLHRDTGSEFVLISNKFYYFGELHIEIPKNLISEVCKRGPAFRYVEEKYANELLNLLRNNYPPGYNGDPMQFKSFTRYDGVS